MYISNRGLAPAIQYIQPKQRICIVLVLCFSVSAVTEKLIFCILLHSTCNSYTHNPVSHSESLTPTDYQEVAKISIIYMFTSPIPPHSIS